jgi:hypothetical protein
VKCHKLKDVSDLSLQMSFVMGNSFLLAYDSCTGGYIVTFVYVHRMYLS